jgi:FkbM family methyltransferase
MIRSMLPKLIDTPAFNAMLRGRYGYMVYNKNDVYIGRAIEKYGEFSEGEVEVFRQLVGAGDGVIEVGANLGTHTLAFSRMVGREGRVYAFEPQRIVFQTLAANLAVNSVVNVECFQVAVSDKPGSLKLPDIDYTVEGNFGAVEIERYQAGIKVPIVTLDDFLDLPPNRKIKFIKIDVEGMEQGVIRGAEKLISAHAPFLYVENDRLEKSPALITQIRDLGYKLYWHLPPLYNPKNMAGDVENIYPNVVSVNMLCVPNAQQIAMNGFVEVAGADDHPFAKK